MKLGNFNRSYKLKLAEIGFKSRSLRLQRSVFLYCMSIILGFCLAQNLLVGKELDGQIWP